MTDEQDKETNEGSIEQSLPQGESPRKNRMGQREY
jgi:hypothetical protein